MPWRRRVDSLPIRWVHTLVVGSGAAGLNAAVQLRKQGIDDLVILTEGLDKGTSINTGSDKQTYYKLSLYGAEADSPLALAETYFAGGSMHGDLALVEAALSARAFLHLVDLGIPFPRDCYGQFVGYKTDHDPRQRATSIGPYTSREMCRALAREAGRLSIAIEEDRHAVELITIAGDNGKRAVGVVAVTSGAQLEIYLAENVVLAVGGPGGLYQASVYPEVHTGAIGLALQAGATAQNLPESQYGLASVAFRWNVSGTYMQVMPRLMSTAADGCSDEREFLADYFESAGQLASNVFLKGYQWPFDSRKLPGGSSIIDILVYIETVLRGRRVFLDYRRNASGFELASLDEPARQYLDKSQALLPTPLERLQKMNPGAVQLYAEHGIDLAAAPLEIAVAAQHNNGGLAADRWWESVNISHLFPVGEVNGSHGVYRPGGSALNAGQVGGIRAAEFIAHRYADWTVPRDDATTAAYQSAASAARWIGVCQSASRSWHEEREELRRRMSHAGAHIRAMPDLETAVPQAWHQYQRIEQSGCRFDGPHEVVESLKTRYLALAHAIYLSAIRFAVESGVGSRGSAIVLDAAGIPIHTRLEEQWRMAPEDDTFRERILETRFVDGGVENLWAPRRPLPQAEAWFENAWAAYREGQIYD